MTTTFHITGLAELELFMDTLPVKIERNIARGAVRDGMNAVLPQARANIHSVSNKLARGLRVGTDSKGGKVWASLRATGEHWFIAKFLEHGTRAHFISVPELEKPINPKASRKQGREVRVSMTTVNRAERLRKSLQIGGHFVGPTVMHKGATPKPFMRPALDARAQTAIIAMAEYIRNRLESKHGIDAPHIKIEGDE